MNRRELYTEMLYVSLGPFGRMSRQKGPAALLQSWWDCGIYLAKIIKDFLLLGRKTVIGDQPVSGKIWLMAGSRNNLHSLQFLREGLPDAVFITLNKKTQAMGAYPRLSLHFAALFWYRLPLLFFRLWHKFREMLLLKPDALFKAVGLEEAALRILKQHKPRALVFANDHVPDMRAFLWAAKTLNIPAIYVQHASVSALFPPLRFDLNLLEGQDSLEKYRQCGPITGEVQLIGMPKFDSYKKYRNLGKDINRIAVCANVLDDQQRIQETVKALSAAFPEMEISFRPHPRDGRKYDFSGNIKLSRADEEGIFEFLKKQDLMIAGDTSTHMEAVLLNIFSIYYSFNDLVSDYYGYVKNGLVKKITSPAELIAFIRKIRENRPGVYLKARPYNALVGTEQEGQSTILAIQLIQSFIGKYD